MKLKKFVHFVSFHIKLFKLLGYWKYDPEDNYQNIYKYYTRLCTVIWIASLISQITALIMKMNNMNEITDIIYIATLCVIAFIKVMAIHRNLDSIKVLMSELDEPLMQPKSKKHVELCQATRTFHRKLFLAFLIMALQIVATFAIVPFFVDERVMVLPGWFPFDWKLSPYYEFVYVFQSLVLLWFSLLSINVDTFSVGLLMQIGLQCDYVCIVLDSIENFHSENGILFVNSEEDADVMLQKNPELFSRVMTENLVICIKHYAALQRLAKDVEDIHRISIFILFLGATLIICSDLFQLTQVTTFEGDTAKFLMLASLLNCMLIQQFMHCWFGNKIIEKSSNIFSSAFNTPWVDCDMKFKKLTLNFLTQTIDPINIKVGGLFVMANTVFISVLRTSYSYFTLLRTMQEKSSLEN